MKRGQGSSKCEHHCPGSTCLPIGVNGNLSYTVNQIKKITKTEHSVLTITKVRELCAFPIC